jgi:hypothetical protein
MQTKSPRYASSLRQVSFPIPLSKKHKGVARCRLTLALHRTANALRTLAARELLSVRLAIFKEAGYPQEVPEYRFTEYFENEVLRKRPYLRKEWCIRVLEQPLKSEPQEQNRYRFWAKIEELEGRVLRVITLEDKITFHNAFPDRGFKP